MAPTTEKKVYISGAQERTESLSEGTTSVEAISVGTFAWSSLWQPAEINPLNHKSTTFPLLRFWDTYSVAFWLATLGFFVAFLSWFAFSPLMPEAVKEDLGLSQDQVMNSNLAALGGAAIVRLLVGPACDRFGPRKVLAALLIIGAVPSGLAAIVTNIHELQAVRFFISILGGTFVPTQAYTTTFFDTSIVGTANAFSGGWGNLGGGVTVAVMIGLFERFKTSGYPSHLSWRLCFLVVPLPCLVLAAAFILLVGRDHPTGRWSKRHNSIRPMGTEVDCTIASGIATGQDTPVDQEKPVMGSTVETAKAISLAVTQTEPLTKEALLEILQDLRVWTCAVCYLLTFGLETALDAALPGLIYNLFQSESFTAVEAAYAASTYGLMNLFARPLGGIVSDLLYKRYGLRSKVQWLFVTAFAQGIAMIGLGVYIDSKAATIGGVIGFIVLIAVTGFAANGACYSVYGHLRPKNIGAVAGLIGAGGNVGGIIYTLIFKYQPGKTLTNSTLYPRGFNSLGRKFWIAGIVNAVGVLPALFLPLGDAI